MLHLPFTLGSLSAEKNVTSPLPVPAIVPSLLEALSSKPRGTACLHSKPCLPKMILSGSFTIATEKELIQALKWRVSQVQIDTKESLAE